jgi:hypothetical protein
MNMNVKEELKCFITETMPLITKGEMKGIVIRNAQAMSKSLRRTSSLGFLSASFPPTRYPIESATIMIPMILVQTNVEVPKKGAMSLEADSSTAMMHIPEKKARIYM